MLSGLFWPADSDKTAIARQFTEARLICGARLEYSDAGHDSPHHGTLGLQTSADDIHEMLYSGRRKPVGICRCPFHGSEDLRASGCGY